MYNGLLHAHSGLRYIVLILMLLLIIQSLRGWLKKSESKRSHVRTSAISMSFVHIQFLIGAALFFLSPKVLVSADMFKSALVRFFTLEHPLMMLIAIALVTIGHVKAKKIRDFRAHKQLFWYNIIALIIILASIPWPVRNLGAGWF